MNEHLKEVHERLISCNLGASVRVSLLGDNWNGFSALACFLLTADRFENIQELEDTITNCLVNLNVRIEHINTGALRITTINK